MKSKATSDAVAATEKSYEQLTNLNPKPFHFTDKKGRTWDCSFDLAVGARIDKSDFSNYQKPGDPHFTILQPDQRQLQRLVMSDAPFLFAVIWIIVQEQAEHLYKLGSFPISPKEDQEAAQIEFASAVNGPTIQAARKAFGEAIVDFFPELRIALSTWVSQAAMVMEKVEQKMREMDPVLEQMVEQEMETGFQRLRTDLEKTRDARHGDVSSRLLRTLESPTTSSTPEATPSGV